MSGRVGAILSPYIIELGPLTGQSWLPMAVFAGAALLRQRTETVQKRDEGVYCS